MAETNDELNFIVPAHPAGMPETEVMRLEEVLKEVDGEELSDSAINVCKAEYLAAINPKLTLPLGAICNLEIEVIPHFGNLPEMVWETSDPTVILFHPSVNAVQGVIECIKEGEATVTATNPLNNSQKVEWEITVGEAKKEEDPSEGGNEEQGEGGENSENPEEPTTPSTPNED